MKQEALRRRARAGLAEAADRAGARAHFRAMGIDPARLSGPIVGVASTWTGTMPCNLNLRALADDVCAAVTECGGVALPFNTIAVSDNQTQGTPGTRASLVSREVIMDSIELMGLRARLRRARLPGRPRQDGARRPHGALAGSTSRRSS